MANKPASIARKGRGIVDQRRIELASSVKKTLAVQATTATCASQSTRRSFHSLQSSDNARVTGNHPEATPGSNKIISCLPTTRPIASRRPCSAYPDFEQCLAYSHPSVRPTKNAALGLTRRKARPRR